MNPTTPFPVRVCLAEKLHCAILQERITSSIDFPRYCWRFIYDFLFPTLLQSLWGIVTLIMYQKRPLTCVWREKLFCHSAVFCQVWATNAMFSAAFTFLVIALAHWFGRRSCLCQFISVSTFFRSHPILSFLIHRSFLKKPQNEIVQLTGISVGK